MSYADSFVGCAAVVGRSMIDGGRQPRGAWNRRGRVCASGRRGLPTPWRGSGRRSSRRLRSIGSWARSSVASQLRVAKFRRWMSSDRRFPGGGPGWPRMLALRRCRGGSSGCSVSPQRIARPLGRCRTRLRQRCGSSSVRGCHGGCRRERGEDGLLVATSPACVSPTVPSCKHAASRLVGSCSILAPTLVEWPFRV